MVSLMDEHGVLAVHFGSHNINKHNVNTTNINDSLTVVVFRFMVFFLFLKSGSTAAIMMAVATELGFDFMRARSLKKMNRPLLHLSCCFVGDESSPLLSTCFCGIDTVLSIPTYVRSCYY